MCTFENENAENAICRQLSLSFSPVNHVCAIRGLESVFLKQPILSLLYLVGRGSMYISVNVHCKPFSQQFYFIQRVNNFLNIFILIVFKLSNVNLCIIFLCFILFLYIVYEYYFIKIFFCDFIIFYLLNSKPSSIPLERNICTQVGCDTHTISLRHNCQHLSVLKKGKFPNSLNIAKVIPSVNLA